ncbi:hypothetical protein HPP92_021572 [Vanilla planifolia]|uniref:Autophagy-related protein 11 n=1 Tax=Vanilla planifolia TaxID=51239 RepID=A0A835Q2T2_VANPL|nr:hypothetical protein HPP92_021572 [Vanilla planifolia]
MSYGSSTTSDEFVPGRKLLVHLAENGHSFEIECDGSTYVEAIQRSIESICRVHLSDQLLLCLNVSLDSQQTLAHYKLPQDDREVFLYNKSRLFADSPKPEAETIDLPKVTLPSASQSAHPLDEASDPAMKALACYERQFRYHFQYANAIYGCAQTKLEVSKRLLREQQVQERALEIAKGNLNLTFRKLQQRYNEFNTYFNQQHRCHSALINNFERDVERLRSVKLLPLLQTDSRKCLLDLVKENDLRKWADNCFSSHKHFENKVSQFKINFSELKRKVDNVFSGMNSANIKGLELMVKEHQKVFNEQKSLMQSLSKDVSTVKKLVDDCLNCQLSTSVRPHDAVSALGPMYEVHEKNHLPKLQNCDNVMAKLLDKSLAKKNEMNMLIHFCMQKLKSAQLSIKDTMNELHAFFEVMGHKEKEFENLKVINAVGHAYRACLAEVVRRKSSKKLYMGLAGQLQERLAAEREVEIRRREGFLKSWSKYIPRDVLASMGLFDSPNPCNVNMDTFDSNLLDIDAFDVDRFAPQSLIGIFPRFERSKSGKICLTTLTDSSNLTLVDENLCDLPEKVDFEAMTEQYLPVDISGTSKLEVENARLKADLASAITLICSLRAETAYETIDGLDPDDMLKTMNEKTAEALHSKDEYIKQLQSILNMKGLQCLTYEKRIHELEQRLADQYQEGQKVSANKIASDSLLSDLKIGGYAADIYGAGEAQNPCISTVSMEEASCISASGDPCLDLMGTGQSKLGEVGDGMIDLSGMLNMSSADPSVNVIDTSMVEPSHDEHEGGDIDEERVSHVDRHEIGETKKTDMKPIQGISDVSAKVADMFSDGTAVNLDANSKPRDNIVSDLQNALAEKSIQCDISENKHKVALEEISSLKRDLEIKLNLLDESQVNCAHLEKCLHEAREEARTNLCTAERKASEYNALRATALKMHSLLERFRNCVTGFDKVINFADSLHTFALSLGSGSIDDGQADISAKFKTCILIISEKAGLLIESVEHSKKQVEDQSELIYSLYRKLQIEKQACKEKISFNRFEVHELAAFVLNCSGNYEAINRNCPNYYLSSESVALFTEHSSKPAYIIGQIVHIEKQIVRPPSSQKATQESLTEPLCLESSSRLSVGVNKSNPYELPVGCEYFIVTIAMLPEAIHSSAS